MAVEKKAKMVATTRVGYDENKVALPGEAFDIAEDQVERLEMAGAAQRVEEPKVPRGKKGQEASGGGE